jgi:DUF971 family protein
MDQQNWPEEIRLTDSRRTLRLAFDNGESFELSAEFLRVHSPSAEVQGHGPDQKITVAGKADVGVRELVPVGNYAIRIVFDDGHDTGIFSWTTLHAMGSRRDDMWGDYLADLASKGLSRQSS